MSMIAKTLPVVGEGEGRGVEGAGLGLRARLLPEHGVQRRVSSDLVADGRQGVLLAAEC